MSKTELHFFTIADYEEEEAFLREKHKSGLRLVKVIPPFFYIFEECEPADMIYRLDYKNEIQDDEYIKMFDDFGWEYFYRCMGWTYFRKAASEVHSENEGEIFSDSESKLRMINHIFRTRMMPIFIIFLACVVPNIITFLINPKGMFVPVLTAVFMLLAALDVYLIFHCVTKLRKLRRKYDIE